MVVMKKRREMYNFADLKREVKENRKEMQELREKMDSLIETMEVLADKRAMKAIAQSGEDIQAGRVRKWSEVRKEFLGGK